MSNNPFERVLTGARAEDNYGYCRAIRVGDRVLDTYAQTRMVLARIEDALGSLGLGLENVIRTTVYFTDKDGIPDLIRAHGESFKDVKPVSTAVGIAFLFHPDLLVEVEAEAVG
jgi:enamine deaminase RidA (YjgF/YER057c/UK114 family)